METFWVLNFCCFFRTFSLCFKLKIDHSKHNKLQKFRFEEVACTKSLYYLVINLNKLLVIFLHKLANYKLFKLNY